MGDWLRRDDDRRLHVDLQGQPLWAIFVLGIAAVAVIVWLARVVDPYPEIPRWMPAAIEGAGWTVIGVAVLFAAVHVSRRLLHTDAKSGSRGGRNRSRSDR